jgi:hypothetical protein
MVLAAVGSLSEVSCLILLSKSSQIVEQALGTCSAASWILDSEDYARIATIAFTYKGKGKVVPVLN